MNEKKAKDDEEERTRRAIEEELKAEMERTVAAEMNRMEQLLNPRLAIQGQLEGRFHWLEISYPGGNCSIKMTENCISI